MASSAEKCVPLLPSPEEELDLLTTTCVAAGEIPLSYFNGDKALDVTFKTGNSPVSAADHAVNAMLMDRLTTARPDYGWLSEETLDEDPARRLNSARCFVVDPIDGTRGFINGSDQWCISAAIVEDNRPLVAVLVCPARGEVFTAIRGGGASLNGKPIKLEPGTDDAPLVGGAAHLHR